MVDLENPISRNKILKVAEVFKTMDVGEKIEDTSKAMEWIKLKTKNGIYSDLKEEMKPLDKTMSIINSIDNSQLCEIPIYSNPLFLLQELETAENKWAGKLHQSEIMHKFGTAIQENQDLFVQLEIVVRGILGKDTRKAVPLLTDYLQYYSSYIYKKKNDNEERFTDHINVIELSDETYLPIIGYLLAQFLLAGSKILLQTTIKLSLIGSLLIDIAESVGIPPGTIQLFVSDMNLRNVASEKIRTISIFADLYHGDTDGFDKRILSFYSSGGQMIVFEDADLDSACESVVDAAWSFTGMLPFSVRNIYIQENIFRKFVDKLKQRIKNIEVGSALNTNCDISFCHEFSKNSDFQRVVDSTKSQGVEVYQLDENSKSSTPTIFIGANVSNETESIVALRAFRTTSEAIKLASADANSQQMYTSVWTENTGLVNEIIGKLKASNIWINSHGLFAADIPVYFHEYGWRTVFGRPPLYYDGRLLDGNSKTIQEILHMFSFDFENIDAKFKKAKSNAKNGQKNWCKLSRAERVKHMQKFALQISNCNPDWKRDWISETNSYITENSNNNFVSIKDYNILTIQEPCGVVAIEPAFRRDDKTLVISAIIEGNSVLLLNDTTIFVHCSYNFYTGLSKFLPVGVLTVLNNDLLKWKCALYYLKEVSFKDNHDPANEKVTISKNVWFNAGQNFI